MSTAVESIIAVFAVSLVSLIGVFSFPLAHSNMKKILSFFVSFATGVLLGDVFLHLIPDIYEKIGLEVKVSLLILLGMLLFFSLEKFVKWQHCHEPDCEEHKLNKGLVAVNFFGDALHNFFDGILITSSFYASFPLGMTTTLAVMSHEIPQEVGDFFILLHAGLDRRKALLYNLFSALFALVGVGATVAIGTRLEDFYLYILPVTAGGFLYIAGSDLVPELHKQNQISESVQQLIGIVFGILLMLILV